MAMNMDWFLLNLTWLLIGLSSGLAGVFPAARATLLSLALTCIATWLLVVTLEKPCPVPARDENEEE
jgi:hypothetical protein